VEVVFRFDADGISFEVGGPEPFVRRHLEFLAPFLRRATGTPSPAGTAPGAPAGLDGVASWWRDRVPAGADPSLQDSILLFAYYMRSYRKTVFVSEDIRRCFALLGVEEPKSLLQILGTLKRDHGLLLNAGRRGEYMMNTTGIARAREILGESRGGGGGAPGFPAGEARPKAPDALTIFKD
jgi:hypothetical protein